MVDQLVIDSSVAAKWFLRDEEEPALADDLLLAILTEDIDGHVPTVFFYEVSHLLSKATRQPSPGKPRIDGDHAVRCVRQLFQIPLQVQDLSEEECVDSVGLSAEFGKSCYDMAFLRLARELGCRWCTADGKVRNGVPDSFPQSHVVLLSELQSA